ncbi:MAG: LLM class F420-dependent oxidoreductase [Acidimicrobiia bacterium]
MKISFKMSQQQTTWPELLAVWRLADDIDVYEGGWLFDHFYPLNADPGDDCFEAWTVAAALASTTTRLRIGHMVTSNTYRHPAVVANMVATLDHISDGRFDFGFGAGWFEDEHAAYGIPLPPLTERFDRFDEALAVIDLLLTERQATYDGTYYQLKDAYNEPKGVQSPRPPFVIGGKGVKRLLRSAAMWADHYNYPGEDIEDFQYRLEVLAEHCSHVGRDYSEIEKSVQVRVYDVAEAAEKGAAAKEAGAHYIVYYLPPPADISLVEPLAAAVESLR